MRKSLALQAEMAAGVRRLRVRRHARLRGRRPGGRRGRACRAGDRTGAVGGARHAGRRPGPSGRPSRVSGRRDDHRRPRRPSPEPPDGAQGGVGGRCARGRAGARGRRRRGAAAARADRIAAGGAPCLRDRGPSEGAVAELRADGFRLLAWRRHPGRRHGRGRPVHAPAGSARQARDRLRRACARQGALALRRDRVQRHRRDARRAPRRAPSNSATPGCGASIRTRSARSSRPSRRTSGRSNRYKNHCRRRPAAWAPVSIDGALHDRASYRHFWQVLERAHATGRSLPSEARRGLHPSSSPETQPPERTIP